MKKPKKIRSIKHQITFTFIGLMFLSILTISIINGVFLDELDPNRGRMSDEIMQDCGIMCYLAFNESERNDENDKERIDSKGQRQAV